jgi:RNA polymerase sigma factor (sigma-70 family)
MDLWYVEKAAKEYLDDVNFGVLKSKADAWVDVAFAHLSNTRVLYEMAMNFLATKRGCEVAFSNVQRRGKEVEFKNENIALVRMTFIKCFSCPCIPYGIMQRIVGELQPTRFFLFSVLNEEIASIKSKMESQTPVNESEMAAHLQGCLELKATYLQILNFLCSSCYLLVPKLAQEIKTDKLSPEDCIAYGNMGLVKAAHRFDFSRVNLDNDKPIRFTTYARWWIRERILNAIERSTFVLSVDCKTREAYYKSTKGIILDENLIAEGEAAAYPLDLYEAISGESSFEDVIDNSCCIGTPIKSPEQEVEEKDWAAAARELFPKVLTDLEYKVLSYRFEALNCECEMDEGAISKELNMPRTRVQGLLNAALKKIRNNVRCLELLGALVVESSRMSHCEPY